MFNQCLIIHDHAHLTIRIFSNHLLKIHLKRTIDFFICLDVFVWFLLLFFLFWQLKIWNFLHYLIDVVHGIRYSLFLCRIHDLLHALGNFLLKIYCIKPFRIYFDWWNRYRIVFILSRILHFIHIDMRQPISGFFRFAECTVLLLLRLCQWLIKHLKFQCTLYIWTITKPKNQFITGLNALFTHSCFVIQISQLISPFFGILLFFQFFKDRYQFFIRSPLGLFDVIA